MFNFLFARNRGGTFVLRIEDTDRQRSKQEYTDGILESLRWLGLSWDEGPIFQSRRAALYEEATETLLRKGLAYTRRDPGKGEAVVFRLPKEPVEFEDAIHGRIRIDLAQDPDLVLRKSDGSPTYNFACVVDDAEMGITHVIRGDDHIYNTPKQIALYRALGRPIPEYAHIPLILNPDGSKMSKRAEVPAFVLDYREGGYLPEALVNFLALLGWSPGEDRERMRLDEMIRRFSLDRINDSPARFDIEKLKAFNRHYIQERPTEELVELCRPFLERGFPGREIGPARVWELVRVYRNRMGVLKDIVRLSRFAFERPPLDERAVKKHLRKDGAAEVLERWARRIERMSSEGRFTGGEIEGTLKELAEETGRKTAQIAQPLRVAVTGVDRSPPIHETLLLVGAEEACRRIREALKELERTGSRG